ncbi:MAG: hypothetical protein K2N86_04270, partial [Rikenellaceae bacterium]|nr:hypothetical protein [Rikenellaceae bacterium]
MKLRPITTGIEKNSHLALTPKSPAATQRAETNRPKLKNSRFIIKIFLNVSFYPTRRPFDTIVACCKIGDYFIKKQILT